MVGMVAISVTDQDHLAFNRGWIRGAEFGDGSLEDERAWWQERTDGAGNCKLFALGLPGVL